MNLLYIGRLALIAFVWILSAFLIFPTCLLLPFHWYNTSLYAQLVTPLSRKILGLRIAIRGKEILEKHPSIIIANHQTALDLVTCGLILPKRTLTLGKIEILFIPFFGQIYWLAGNVLIQRSKHNKAIKTMKKTKQLLLKKGLSLWIMPEGTRSRGRGLLPFKKGAFYTAINAQVPLIPLALSSYKNHVHLSKWRGGRIIIQVLDPIPTEGLTHKDVPRLIKTSHQALKKAIEKLDAELDTTSSIVIS